MPRTYVVSDGSDSSNLTLTAGAKGLTVLRADISVKQASPPDGDNWSCYFEGYRVSSVSGGTSLTPTALRDGGPGCEATALHGATRTSGAELGAWQVRAGETLLLDFPGGIDVGPNNSVFFDWGADSGFSHTLYVNLWFEE